MAVPFFDIQYLLDERRRGELLRRWQEILVHGRFVNGPEIGELEASLSEFLGVEHVVACSNGSDALVLALRAAGVGPGDEVVVPSFTFFATAGAVSRIGAIPVFADVDLDTFLLSPEALAAKTSAATKAVLPVHLYGRPAGCAELRAVAEEAAGHPVQVIEDAAQAVGAVHPDGPCGALGDTAAFSCFPTKNLPAAGDAGFVTTRDGERAAHLRRLREHGGGRQYYHDEVGYNFRHDSLQAAALLVFLPDLLQWNAAREEGAQHYDQLLAEAALGEQVRPPELVPGHVYHQYVLRCQGRDALRDHLQQAGIGCAIYYPLPLHLQPCFAELGGAPGQLPGAEAAAAEVLALPIYPGVTALQREEVVDRIAGFYRNG